MSRVAVIGAGMTGLAAAYRLAVDGHRVTVFEKEGEAGGLAASVRWGDAVLDRNFHFICGGDRAYLDLIDELGLGGRVAWSATRMGHFRDGERHDFGTPLSLLAFTPLPLADRVRFGLSVLRARIGDGEDLDGVRARDWILKTQGPLAYEVIWRPLLTMKFGERGDAVSAAWLRERIRRLATSRRGPLATERLGYVAGGTRIVVERLIEEIVESGGSVRTGSGVDRVDVRQGRAVGVRVRGSDEAFDAVLSTIAPPLFLEAVPDLGPGLRESLSAVDYLGVVTWVVLARRPLSRDFWLNVDDPAAPFPGVITWTNLDPVPGLGAHLHYVPTYMAPDDSRWDAPEERERARLLAGLDVISPGFSGEVLDVLRFRDRWAQPVFDVGFGARTAPAASPVTPIRGLFRTDMSQTYPHDRSLVNAVAKGTEAARAVTGTAYTGSQAPERA